MKKIMLSSVEHEESFITQGSGSCLMRGVSGLFLLSLIISVPVINAKNVEPDLDLHALSVSSIWDTKH